MVLRFSGKWLESLKEPSTLQLIEIEIFSPTVRDGSISITSAVTTLEPIGVAPISAVHKPNRVH